MKKILVIDDAEFILESTATLLGFEGYDVITAPDGLIGVQTALEQRPDLILCDISMPNLDGYGVIKEIRANPITESTPFIFLTAFTEKSNMRQGMEHGADDFLTKPFTREELIAAIDTQWKKHSVIEKQVQDKVDEVGKNVTYALPHEFRTVLNQIMGSARFLISDAETITPTEIVDLSNDIKASVQRLVRITENFLVYVRIESFASHTEKRKQLRTFRTDEPGAIMYDIITNILSNANRYDDLVMGDIVEEITLEMSTENFHKIVDEILDNAIKFSQPNTPISIHSWIDGNMTYVSIEDKGRGMSKDQIGNIGAYKQFERTVYEQQGVGLGLVIAKRLTELHDGKFLIESVEGEGTKVSFGIPCLPLL